MHGLLILIRREEKEGENGLHLRDVLRRYRVERRPRLVLRRAPTARPRSSGS